MTCAIDFEIGITTGKAVGNAMIFTALGKGTAAAVTAVWHSEFKCISNLLCCLLQCSLRWPGAWGGSLQVYTYLRKFFFSLLGWIVRPQRLKRNKQNIVTKSILTLQNHFLLSFLQSWELNPEIHTHSGSTITLSHISLAFFLLLF